MDGKVDIYKEGKNKWRDNRYAFMAKFNLDNGITSFGKAKQSGKTYYHIISENDNDPIYNLLGENLIHDEIEERFKTKAGDKQRVITNTVASQPCCFNLFTPLKIDKYRFLANTLFTDLLEKSVSVLDIQIEFTPSIEESIGDQSVTGGTDADVAIFYIENEKKREGVILIEFKYIEAEFSTCTSYKNKNGGLSNGIRKKNIRPKCDIEDFFNLLIKKDIEYKPTKPDCGYLKYDNWKLTLNSSVFDQGKIINQPSCPFRFSLNQLWRNMLLAEKVGNARSLDDFHFWVIYPKENTYLWHNYKQDVEGSFRNILTDKGNECFRKIELDKDVISVLEKVADGEWVINWLKKFRRKYLAIE